MLQVSCALESESRGNRRQALLSFLLCLLHRIQLSEKEAIMWRNASCRLQFLSFELLVWGLARYLRMLKLPYNHGSDPILGAFISQVTEWRCWVQGARGCHGNLGCGCHEGNLGLLIPGTLLFLLSAGQSFPTWPIILLMSGMMGGVWALNWWTLSKKRP